MMSSSGWNNLLPSFEDAEQSRGIAKKTMSIGVATRSPAVLEIVPSDFLSSFRLDVYRILRGVGDATSVNS